MDTKTITADDVFYDEKTGRHMVRGPGKINGPEMTQLIQDLVSEGKMNLKLPFEGTNIVVSKNQDFLDSTGANLGKKPLVKPVPKKLKKKKVKSVIPKAVQSGIDTVKQDMNSLLEKYGVNKKE